MTDRCIFCGAPAEHRHHPTARDGSGRYLDPAFVVPACVICHRCDHAAQHDAGLDALSDPLRARAWRTVWLLGRLADLDLPVTIDSVALRGLHGVTLAIVEHIGRGSR
jgi:hypothetical protein